MEERAMATLSGVLYNILAMLTEYGTVQFCLLMVCELLSRIYERKESVQFCAIRQNTLPTSVVDPDTHPHPDPDPDWIRIQWGPKIRPDSQSGSGSKRVKTVQNKRKK